jgi:hypothetical protein
MNPGVAIFLLILTIVLIAGAGTASGFLIKNALKSSPRSEPVPTPVPTPNPSPKPVPNPGAQPSPNPSPVPVPNPGSQPSPTPSPVPVPAAVPRPAGPPSVAPYVKQAAYISGVAGVKNLIANITPQEAKFNVLILSFLYPLSTVYENPSTKTFYPQNVTNASTFTLAWENGFASSALPSYYLDNASLAWLLQFQAVVNNGVQNRVLFSVGGASYSNGANGIQNPYPLWVGNENQVATGIVTFIRNFQAYTGTPGKPDDTGNHGFLFDGIDIDFEDTNALKSGGAYNGQTMLNNLTTALRIAMNNFQPLATPAVNGNLFNFISHAPQANYMSYLGSAEYGAAAAYYPVINAVGNLIDLYNIQFYNNPNWTGSGPLNTSANITVPFPIANTLWGLVTGKTSGSQSGNQTLTKVPIAKIAIGAAAGAQPDVTPSNIVNQYGNDSVAPHRQFSLMFWTQAPPDIPNFSIAQYVGDLVTAFYA